MKKATAVRKPLDTIAFPRRSRYTCQLDPGDPGSGNLANPGVEGLDRSREDAREEASEVITSSSRAEVAKAVDVGQFECHQNTESRQ
jgi:hypothetical protein